MKALILTWEKFQDHEVIYPYYRVQEDGFEVDIMSNKIGKIFGILGTYMDFSREKIKYGVDVFPNEEKNSKIGELLKQPFEPYQRPTIEPDKIKL